MILEHNGNGRGAERKNKFYRREGKGGFSRGQKFCCGRKILSAVKGKIRRYRAAREMRDRAARGVRKKKMRKFRLRGRRTLPHGERRRANIIFKGRSARKATEKRGGGFRDGAEKFVRRDGESFGRVGKIGQLFSAADLIL